MQLVLKIAASRLGTREQAGLKDNPWIVALLAAVGLRNEHDETAWCSAFMNWVMRQAGLQGTGSAAARSWLAWGVPLAVPVVGCVVVFKRDPNPAQGHVALFLADLGDTLLVLGGNQGNAVSVAEYPKERMLGYRTAA